HTRRATTLPSLSPLLLRRPPRPSLFPYTTLFRSASGPVAASNCTTAPRTFNTSPSWLSGFLNTRAKRRLLTNLAFAIFFLRLAFAALAALASAARSSAACAVSCSASVLESRHDDAAAESVDSLSNAPPTPAATPPISRTATTLAVIKKPFFVYQERFVL